MMKILLVDDSIRTRLLLEKTLEEANHKLKEQTAMDGLTGIANRRRFELFYEKEWKRSLRDTTPISLIMADIDLFKAFHDHYGHLAGDEC